MKSYKKVTKKLQNSQESYKIVRKVIKKLQSYKKVIKQLTFPKKLQSYNLYTIRYMFNCNPI